MEEQPFDNTQVVEVKAKDIDGPDNSDPFFFSLPQNCNNPACQNFDLQFNKGNYF